MRNPIRGLRWKITLLCAISVTLAYGTLFLLRELTRAVIVVYPSLLPLSLIDRHINEATGVRLLPILFGIALFMGYILLLSRNTVEQIRNMTKMVKQLSDGHFGEQIPVHAKDELGELANHINEMAQKLKTTMAEERMATQAKNDLVTNVSHDLRTPLTSIVGYLRLVDEDRYLDEIHLRQYINIAYEKALRLGVMVDDLFDFTRMNYGTLSLDWHEVNLTDLMNQLVADFTLLLAQSDVKIRLSVPTDSVIVKGDGNKLVRAFENLISNASKYSDDGQNIDISMTRTDVRVVVRVVNYGHPIPPSALPHIFERFYRVDKSRSREGSGLGLAIVKSIVSLHAGEVAVESTQDQTAFTVYLPLDP